MIRPAVRAAAARLAAPIVPIPIAHHPDCHDGVAIRELLTPDVGEPTSVAELDTPLAVINAVSGCRVMVTGSYHAAIFALAQGIPAVAIPATPYYVEKFAGLAALFPSGCEIVAGPEIFNTRPIVIAGVAGLNAQTFPNGVTAPDPVTGTCTTCHETPNAGNHSVKAPLNIGLADAARRTADMPLCTLRRLSTCETAQTTDPGRAMVTGKWADIGTFKGPILRGLAARAPYFHNGSAATLDEVIDFYESRFNLELTAQERSDLVAFLRAL